MQKISSFASGPLLSYETACGALEPILRLVKGTKFYIRDSLEPPENIFYRIPAAFWGKIFLTIIFELFYKTRDLLPLQDPHDIHFFFQNFY